MKMEADLISHFNEIFAPLKTKLGISFLALRNFQPAEILSKDDFRFSSKLQRRLRPFEQISEIPTKRSLWVSLR